MRLRYSDAAWATLQHLPETQQAQARRLIRAIMLAGTSIGRLWIRDLRGRQLWIASALDTHVIHRIVFARDEDTLYIVQILNFPTPPDPNNP
jgi:hypothetical protein